MRFFTVVQPLTRIQLIANSHRPSRRNSTVELRRTWQCESAVTRIVVRFLCDDSESLLLLKTRLIAIHIASIVTDKNETCSELQFDKIPRVCRMLVMVGADDTEYRLMRDLLRNYDRRVRPSLNASEPLNVTFGLALAQIIDVVRVRLHCSAAPVCLYVRGGFSTFILGEQCGGRDLQRGSVTGKILSVICTNVQFLTYIHYIITEFSSHVSIYIHQKFHLEGVGARPVTGGVAPHLPP